MDMDIDDMVVDEDISRESVPDSKDGSGGTSSSSRSGRRSSSSSVVQMKREVEGLKEHMSEFFDSDRRIPLSIRLSPKTIGVQKYIEEFKEGARDYLNSSGIKPLDIQVSLLDYLSVEGEHREQLTFRDYKEDRGISDIRDRRFLFGGFLDRFGAHEVKKTEQALKDVKNDVKVLVAGLYYNDDPDIGELRDFKDEIIDRCESKGNIYCTPIKNTVDDVYIMNKMRRLFVEDKLDDDFCEVEPDLCKSLDEYGDEEAYRKRNMVITDIMEELRSLGY